MRIYIDSEYRCHIDNTDGNFREIETRFFDDKCTVFIEGYRYIPSRESWTRSDGFTFTGEMITPWKDYKELSVAQREYEIQQLIECKEALSELGVEI